MLHYLRKIPFETRINGMVGLTQIFLKLSCRTDVRHLQILKHVDKFLDFSYSLEVTSQLINYYERIQDELSDQIIYLEDIRTSIEVLISLNKRNIELFNMNNPDSLFKLEASIGAVGTSWTADYSFPYFEEFIGSEYFSKVQNDELKKQLRDLKARVVDATFANTFTDTQYQSVIEPYIIKNYNYQNSAMPRYQEFMISGGPKTDYSKFLKDFEF